MGILVPAMGILLVQGVVLVEARQVAWAAGPQAGLVVGLLGWGGMALVTAPLRVAMLQRGAAAAGLPCLGLRRSLAMAGTQLALAGIDIALLGGTAAAFLLVQAVLLAYGWWSLAFLGGGLLLLLAASRDLIHQDSHVRSGGWASDGPSPLTHTLEGRPIGIVGLGRIGRTLARKLEIFGGPILYHGRREQAGVPYEFCPDLYDMARRCAALILCLPHDLAVLQAGPEIELAVAVLVEQLSGEIALRVVALLEVEAALELGVLAQMPEFASLEAGDQVRISVEVLVFFLTGDLAAGVEGDP